MSRCNLTTCNNHLIIGRQKGGERATKGVVFRNPNPSSLTKQPQTIFLLSEKCAEKKNGKRKVTLFCLVWCWNILNLIPEELQKVTNPGEILGTMIEGQHSTSARNVLLVQESCHKRTRGICSVYPKGWGLKAIVSNRTGIWLIWLFVVNTGIHKILLKIYFWGNWELPNSLDLNHCVYF